MTKIAANGLKLSVLTAFLLLGLSVIADSPRAGQVTISSLPYTASGSNDTLRLAGTKLSGSGDGIYITGTNLYFDLGSDTLEFGTGGGNDNYGIRFSGGCSGVTVDGGTILHGSQSGNGNNGIFVSLCHDILVRNTDVIVHGVNGHCVASASIGAPGVYNFEIDGGDYWNNCHGYSSRCMYDGAAIRLWSNTYGGHGEYHYRIHNLTIHTSPGQGIMFQGRDQGGNSSLVRVHDNTITCDARNSVYSSYSGTCNSAANPYAIALLKCAPGSMVNNNTVRSGTDYGGGRGILVENCLGTADNPIEIYNNDVRVHEGPNVEYGEGGTPIHALRVRAIDGNSINHIHVHHNSFVSIGDNDLGTSHTGSSVMALRYSDESSTSRIIIEENLFRGEALDDGVPCKAVVFDYANSGGLVMRHNRIESNGILVKYGDNNSGARRIDLMGDTLNILTPAYDGQTYHVGHLSNGWNCTDNYACDIVYEGAASESDINMANGGTLELGLQRNLTVYVEGRNDLPVYDAGVTVTNNYGQTVLSGTTDASGRLNGVVTYWWEQRSGGDSTNFNDFTIRVIKGNDSTITSRTINAASSNPTVILQNTDGSGDPPPQDTTPPARIEDLGVGDPAPTSMRLSWTAPGDDGNVGRAFFYDIRFSRSDITTINWSQATPVDDTPAPGFPGNSETFTITGLDPDTEYYFAIKTRDESDNWSELSNIVSSTTPVSADTTPPAPVSDLAARPGFNLGEILLVWSASGDDSLAGAAAAYEIRFADEWMDENNWDEAVFYGFSQAQNPAGETVNNILTGLEPGNLYFVGIKASDESGNVSGISNIDSAVAKVTLAQDDDSTGVRMMSPADGAVLSGSRPILTVENIDSAGYNVYFFEVSDDSGFSSLLAADTVMQNPGGTTDWMIPVGLDSPGEYFWRVRVNDSPFGGFRSFALAARAHVYPNPFIPAESGEATFTDLPENSELVLLTVSGQPVRQWENVLDGRVTWDGTNDAGGAVASGIYFWYVSGSDIKGKIIVIR